ncbi:MAG: hypothetical protein JXR51_13520 [Bacteroidales bacterium]|nr:hypothetical protein [Bacteroidales bacterium]MBN2758186.1 hypothetical protein [Bacteroidales bacterium]
MKKSLLIFILIINVFFTACKPKSELAKNLQIAENKQQLNFAYLFSEALKSKMHQKYDEAISKFEACLNLNNKSSASAYELSNLYLNKNNVDSAVFFSNIAFSLNPDNEWYILQRAELANLKYDKQTYTKMYEKLVSLQPENLNYLYEYALINFKRNYNDSVINIANRIEKIIGVNESITFLKNNVYFRQKNYIAVINEFEKLINIFPDSIRYVDMLANFYYSTSEYDKAISLYQDNLQKFSDNTLLYFGICKIYTATKKIEKGFPYLLIGLKTDFVNDDEKLEIAQVYIDSKNVFSADTIEDVYEVLIDNLKNNSDITKEYLEYLYTNKNLTKAEDIAKIYIKKNPENFNTWEMLFNILVLQNRYNELDTYTTEALEYFPNQPLVYFFKGHSLFSQKLYEKTIKYCKTGLSLVFDNLSLKLEFLLYLAESNHNILNHKESDFYFEEYLKDNLTNAYLMNNYSYYLAVRNTNLNRALELSRKTLEIEPFNSSFLDTYAWILYLTKQYKQSLNYINRAYIYGGNKNIVIIEHYGDILLMLNRDDEAIEKWNEALELNKTNVNLKNKIENHLKN